MKKNLIILIMMTLMSSLTIAQDKKEERDLSAAVEKLRVAMIEGNQKTLEEVAAEELSYGHSSGYVENKKEFIEKLVSGQSDFVTIQLSNQRITIVGNSAIVRHDLLADTNDNGKAGKVNLHILSVWQKQDGKWKIIARQAVKKQA